MIQIYVSQFITLSSIRLAGRFFYGSLFDLKIKYIVLIIMSYIVKIR